MRRLLNWFLGRRRENIYETLARLEQVAHDDAIKGKIWPPDGPDPIQYQAYLEYYGRIFDVQNGWTNLYYAYGGTDDSRPTASEPSSDSPPELPSSDTSSSC